MLYGFKRRFYFVIAAYFGFWAGLVLRRWRPRIVVITGSSGKTTVLHLVEAQLGDQAIYSHHANGAIGIPFHILGLKTNVTFPFGWIPQFVLAPFKAFRQPPATKLYIVEADCDRPGEGKFVARLLKPEATLWVSVHRTHSMNFEKQVKNGGFKTHEAAIGYEFGYFAEAARQLLAVDADSPEIVAQLPRAKAKVKKASSQAITKFELSPDHTSYTIHGQQIQLPGLHPKEIGVSLQLVNYLLEYLEQPLDKSYRRLVMPPGRSSVLKGKHDTTIIDSTYNTGLGATVAMLKLFDQYPGGHKWLVLGDILEQGSLERQEHERLAAATKTVKAERIILLGPRTAAHSRPILQRDLPSVPIASFDSPKQVLDYINEHLKGGETLFFKGGRFLEGVIEQLLANPGDADRLVRRGSQWVKRRQKWGLPR